MTIQHEFDEEIYVPGCTELPLLLDDEVSSVSCLDTMQIHISSKFILNSVFKNHYVMYNKNEN